MYLLYTLYVPEPTARAPEARIFGDIDARSFQGSGKLEAALASVRREGFKGVRV